MQGLHLIRSNWPFRGAKPDGPSCHSRRRSFWEFLCCPVVVWLEKPVPNSETHQFLSANVVEPKRMTSLCDRPLPVYTPDERLSLFHTGSSCNSMPISSNSCRAGIINFMPCLGCLSVVRTAKYKGWKIGLLTSCCSSLNQCHHLR